MSDAQIVQRSVARFSSDSAEITWHVTIRHRTWSVATWEQRHAATGRMTWSYVIPALGAEGTVVGFSSCEGVLQAAIAALQQHQQRGLRGTVRTWLRRRTAASQQAQRFPNPTILNRKRADDAFAPADRSIADG
jgi:hypothetical protein